MHDGQAHTGCLAGRVEAAAIVENGKMSLFLTKVKPNKDTLRLAVAQGVVDSLLDDADQMALYGVRWLNSSGEPQHGPEAA